MIQNKPYDIMVKYTQQTQWIDGRGNFIAFAFFLGGTVGPLAGGWLYDNIQPSVPFYLNSAFLALGALLVGLLLKETRNSITNSNGEELNTIK